MVLPKTFALIGMPCWTPFQPFYALSLIKELIRSEGHGAMLFDINRAFYTHVDEVEHDCWSGNRNHLWCSPDFCEEMYTKYACFFQARLDELSALSVSIYAFSVNWWNRHMTVRFSRELKRLKPDIPVLFGGVDCFPREVGSGFLQPPYEGCCDIICMGEGEIAMRQFVRDFAATGRVTTQVPGFAWHERGRVVSTGEAELPKLRGDTVWADFSDYFGEVREATPPCDSGLVPISSPISQLGCEKNVPSITSGQTIPFYLSRGCVYRCHFCSERPNFHHFRSRDIVEAVDELEYILKSWCGDAIPFFDFADSNFNADISQLKKFVKEVKKRALHFTWGGQGHFEPTLTNDFLQELYESGLRGVSWGFESGSQHVIDLMNKRFNLTEARRIIRRCHELGITSTLNLIVGYPGETPEDVFETMKFIFENRKYAQFNTPGALVVRPNSPLYEQPEKHNLANTIYYAWKSLDGNNTISVRVLRRFILNQVINNKELNHEYMVDNEEIQNVDFNDIVVKKEILQIVKCFCNIIDIRSYNLFKLIDNDCKKYILNDILFCIKKMRDLYINDFK